VQQDGGGGGDGGGDPLTINFGGGDATLTRQDFSFDLRGDGTMHSVRFATASSGFVALDRNGNGSIDNGTELFGSRTDDGFAELKEFDSNGDSVIDARDDRYADLMTISIDESGAGTGRYLAETGVSLIPTSGAKVSRTISDVDRPDQITASITEEAHIQTASGAATVQNLILTAAGSRANPAFANNDSGGGA